MNWDGNDKEDRKKLYIRRSPFLCSWEKSDGSPSHIVINGPSFDDQSYEDERCKTGTRHKSDQEYNEKAYISAGRWDVQTHTNQRSIMLGAFPRSQFLYSIQQIETKKKWSKTKFNLANVNAKSNCFGTLTICVRSCMPAVHFLSLAFISVSFCKYSFYGYRFHRKNLWSRKLVCWLINQINFLFFYLISFFL